MTIGTIALIELDPKLPADAAGGGTTVSSREVGILLAVISLVVLGVGVILYRRHMQRLDKLDLERHGRVGQPLRRANASTTGGGRRRRRRRSRSSNPTLADGRGLPPRRNADIRSV